MSKRIPTVTRELIVSAIPPVNTKSYTTIPHGDVIKITEQLLGEQGFDIVQERYKCTKSAQVAQGIYYLNYGSDPEMKMMFAWSNSYDKSMRFRCGIGGSLENGATILSGTNLGSWSRRHSGTALQETTDTIKNQITHAGEYYQKLVEDKDYMKSVKLDFTTQSALAGRLFIEADLLNTEQISEMKVWIRENQSNDTLWDLYTYTVTALQKCHPVKWMDCQIAAHLWVCKEFNIPVLPKTVSQPKEDTVVVFENDLDGVYRAGIDPIGNTGHQITLEESIAEIAEETGIPLVIDMSQVPAMSLEEGIIAATKAEITITPDQIYEKHFGKSKPAVKDLMEQIKQQASESAEDFSKSNDTDPEFQENQEETSDTGSVNHLFTVDSTEDMVCKICGKDIMDPIHDEF